ncbi:hypothetical protein AURDEDRAFT_123907 [Auricularia subglabra TFB-10046 SS5]|nr:hypothetical protein AURDEDRAFT_123907 [Auricularia subglabra TFB-10046 SS5]
MADRPRFTTQGRTEPRKYFTAADEDVPSPPPSRPRSRSLPISGASGALARIARRKEAEDTAQGDIVIDTSAASAVPATQRAIDRVPTEIISAILTAWMVEESSTPYGLGNRVPFYAMKICSFWRRAAKATLYLWQHPNFCFRQMLKNTDVWIAYHACFVRYGGTQGFHVTLENSVSAVLETNAAWAHFRERILVKARSIDLEVGNSMADDDILARRRAIRHAEDIRSRSLFPNATTLELADFASNWPFWRSFIETSCPAVTTLCVRRNHVDHTAQFLTGMGTLSQLRTLVFRDGSLNADIVNGLVRPMHGLPMPFVGLRTIRFGNAVPREDFQYECIQSALRLRYSYLPRDRRPTRFVFTCTLKPRFEDPAYDVSRERIARTVLRWNEEEFERAKGIWKYM